MQHVEFVQFVGHTTHKLHMGFARTTAEMPQRETANSGSGGVLRGQGSPWRHNDRLLKAASALRGSGLHRLFFDATLERNTKVT